MITLVKLAIETENNTAMINRGRITKEKIVKSGYDEKRTKSETTKSVNKEGMMKMICNTYLKSKSSKRAKNTKIKAHNSLPL